MLWSSGIKNPRKFASEEDLTAIAKGYAELEFRLGAKECIQKLRAAGFRVLGLTTGDRDTVLGYFKRSGVDMSKEDLRSCDGIHVAKPDPGSYKPLLKELSSDGGQPW